MTSKKMPAFIKFATVFMTALVCAGQAWGAAPAGQYALSSGIVQDRRTGLIWQRSPDTTRRSATAAADYCANLEVGVTWRVPSIRELMTLVDVGATTAPVIDASAFPGTGAQAYWTATTYGDPNMQGAKWAVDFSTGIPNGVAGATTNLLVRCVR